MGLVLDHPHVVRLENVYESDEELHLVMEYMSGGELWTRLNSQANKQYSEQVAADTTRQMLLAVAYLHSHQVVHRDLKLENFLYEKEDSDHVKLIDFGFARFWDGRTMMHYFCGTPSYIAPEVVERSYTEKAKRTRKSFRESDNVARIGLGLISSLFRRALKSLCNRSS